MINSEYWKNRGTEKWDWVEQHWQTISHPHRQQIIDELKEFEWNSLLELGCGCGVNLYNIRKEFGYNKLLVGIDISGASIKYARSKMADVAFIEEDILTLDIKEPKFDVILCDAVLMYVPHTEIKQMIKKITDSAKNIILCEWWNDNILGVERCGHFARNYTKLLNEYGYKVKIKEINWNEKGWKKYGKLFIANK